MKLSPTLTGLRTYPFVRLEEAKARLRADGVDFIDFGIGEPREDTPAFIREALVAALELLSTYPSALGLAELREAIAGWASGRFGVALDPDAQVLPTMGSKEAIFHMAQVLGGRYVALRFIADRHIYAYDTFAGMPRPEAIDDRGPDAANHTTWETHRTDEDGDAGSNWMRASLDTVRQRLSRLSYPDDRLHFVQGLVEQTIPAVTPDRIAILRLDTDFYSSTKHELEHLYPRLSDSGVLIIDDYGAMPGCRTATDEYATHNGIDWFLHRVDAHVRLTIKPSPR